MIFADSPKILLSFGPFFSGRSGEIWGIVLSPPFLISPLEPTAYLPVDVDDRVSDQSIFSNGRYTSALFSIFMTQPTRSRVGVECLKMNAFPNLSDVELYLKMRLFYKHIVGESTSIYLYCVTRFIVNSLSLLSTATVNFPTK